MAKKSAAIRKSDEETTQKQQAWVNKNLEVYLKYKKYEKVFQQDMDTVLTYLSSCISTAGETEEGGIGVGEIGQVEEGPEYESGGVGDPEE